MKAQISALKASGGADIPEMCLSGLQVQTSDDWAEDNIINNM